MLDDERGIEDIINLNASDDTDDKEEIDSKAPSLEKTEKEETVSEETENDEKTVPEQTMTVTGGGETDLFDKTDEKETTEEYEDDSEAENEEENDEEPYDGELYDEDNYDDLEEDGEKQSRLWLIPAIGIPTALIVCIIAFIVFSDSDIASGYRENFRENISSIAHDTGIDLMLKKDDDDEEHTEQKKPKNTGGSYNENVKTAVTVPFENAVTYASFAQYKRGAACAGENYLLYIRRNGEEQRRMNTTVTNPIIKAEGRYIALAEKGGRKLCLYSDEKLLYDIYTDENILSLGMNDRGDIVVVTEKASYMGAVSVYNKSGENIFTWSSGGGMITAADISSGSRRVAAAVVNTDSRVYSTVSLFDVKKEDSYSQIICEDTLIFDMSYSQKQLNVFGDNSMIGITEEGDVVYDKRFDNAGLSHSAVDQNGNKLMAFEYNNAPAINVYSKNGSLQYTMGAETMPQSVDIQSANVIYNENRDIILGRPDSKRPYKYTAAMDVKDIVLIDAKSFLIVYSNSIEAVSFK